MKMFPDTRFYVFGHFVSQVSFDEKGWTAKIIAAQRADDIEANGATLEDALRALAEILDPKH